ncbi:hypothetical protein Hanom_Chr08g00707361 [Helianthus anomalus]
MIIIGSRCSIFWCCIWVYISAGISVFITSTSRVRITFWFPKIISFPSMHIA